MHEHPPSCCCSRVLERDRLEQAELFAGHSTLLLHLEGTALGRVLQQLKNLLPGHAAPASSPANPKPASFEVKSLLISGTEQNESKELRCFRQPQACWRSTYSEHQPPAASQQRGHWTLTWFVAWSDKSRDRLSNFCAQGNQGTLKHWDTTQGTWATGCQHRATPLDVTVLMPGVTLTAVPHSFLSNWPERGPQAPWGKGPRPGAHRNLCIGETLLSAWWAGAHFLGVRQMVWSQYLLPAMLSLPQSQPGCVCGIWRSSGWRSSWQTSSCKVRLPSRHKANIKKPSMMSGPSARCRVVSLLPQPGTGTAAFGDLRCRIPADLYGMK